MSQSKIFKFLKRARDSSEGTSSSNDSNSSPCTSSMPSVPKDVDLNDLPWDPAERLKISEYHPNLRDEIRRKYLLKGPCQPRDHDFPPKELGKKLRRFNKAWFDQYPNWLEYSIKEDKAFCLCCYLFKDQIGKQAGGDAFVIEGFSSWNKTERLTSHVGGVNSSHNKCLEKCENLIRQEQLITTSSEKQIDIQKENSIYLNVSIDVARWLLHQGLAFRGHDESDGSSKEENFKALLDFTIDQCDIARKVVLKKARENDELDSPSIQNDIVHYFAQEVVKSILDEIGDDVFALLVDESNDISNKEQMVVVLRYVNKYGEVKERIVALVHVAETSSSYLKSAIDSLFTELGLSLKNVRGQGYDGANNMRDEFNGLRALITRENNSAYYVHCFAHQLQLVVAAVARKHVGVGIFFEMIGVLLNVVGGSCKKRDMIRESHLEEVQRAICSDEIETGECEVGTGIWLNQERTLCRAEDIRWGSHYETLLRVAEMYSSILDVLEYVENEGRDYSKRGQACSLQVYFQSFDFVFYLHLMMHILGLTRSLSMALQRRDQDILEAMLMIGPVKQQLQKFREDGWDSLLEKISLFCEKNDVSMLKMEDEFVTHKRPRQKTNVSNLHHYLVDCFYTIVDLQLQEFNDRFNEVNIELLTCIASLDPKNLFQAFSESKLMRLSEFYPDDFNFLDKHVLEHQLVTYIDNVRHDERLANLKSLGDLAKALVNTRKHLSYPLVYRLLKLALILPVTTATVERYFSSMMFVKHVFRNCVSNYSLSDCVICYIEKDVLEHVSNDVVIHRFQKMKTRSGQM